MLALPIDTQLSQEWFLLFCIVVNYRLVFGIWYLVFGMHCKPRNTLLPVQARIGRAVPYIILR